MRRVVQKDATGCGLACIAMLAERKYEEVKSLAMEELNFEIDGYFYTQTKHLVALGNKFNIKIGKRRRKFKGYKFLPDKAILAINYDKEFNSWHWVVYHRSASGDYVLDPGKNIKQNKRTDLDRIASKTKHWLGVGA